MSDRKHYFCEHESGLEGVTVLALEALPGKTLDTE
jgi:hypothetical protein